MNKMIIDENISNQKPLQIFRSISPKITKEMQNNIQTPIKQPNSAKRINSSYNQLSDSINNVPPYQCEDDQLDPKEIELDLQPKAAIKRKKDWRSWSSQEKIHFYEIIANGGNYSSLQKLFKTMNDKIGTKSTEKIRDYYYRMLKNVNTLLKSAGEMGLNSKNRDEVILAIGCYGKLLNSSSKKHKLDMKKLNKHPRLFKRIANTLKKLITKQIKMVRTKKINNLSNSGNKSTKQKIIPKSTNSGSNNIIRPGKSSIEANKNETTDFSRVINVTKFRNITYESFILRITPYDKETYLKMIMENYCPRIEISVALSKPIKYIIDILSEKWKNVPKNNAKNVFYLLPLEELWMPKQLTQFSASDNTNSFDIGDIYTSYGNPSTNILYMYYQWVEVKNDSKAHLEIVNNLKNRDGMIIDNSSNKNNKFFSNMNENQYSNCAMKNDNSFDVDISDDEEEEEQEQEQEKSFMPLESDLNIFDPLEFFGFENEKKDSSEEEEDLNRYNNNQAATINHLPNKNIFITKKSVRHNNISRSYVESANNNNNNQNNNNSTINNNQNKTNNNNNNSKLRTDYSELFSRSECGLLLTNKSNQYNNEDKLKLARRKIPFSNNVNKEDIPISDQFNTSLRNLHVLSNKSSDIKDNQIDSSKNIAINARDNTPIKANEEIKSTEVNRLQDQFSDIDNKLISIQTPKKQAPTTHIPFNNNFNKNYASNFGFTALFQSDLNTKIHNNNTNLIELNNNPEISNLLNQNSLNYNSIFEYADNNNTNVDMFKHNFNNTNIFKMEYQNNNSNNFAFNNNNNPSPQSKVYNTDVNYDQECKDGSSIQDNAQNTINETNKIKDRDATDSFLKKKTKRNKEKKIREKITIEEIEESQKKKKLQKMKNTLTQQSPSSCIINHNNYFNFPGQYYPHITTANMPIPLPSNFFKESNNNELSKHN